MSDEEILDEEINNNIINEEIIDDSLIFVKDYEKLKKNNISHPYLTKFEKAKVVSEDETETSGKRMLLNLGHTFGHAIEADSNTILSI